MNWWLLAGWLNFCYCIWRCYRACEAFHAGSESQRFWAYFWYVAMYLTILECACLGH